MTDRYTVTHSPFGFENAVGQHRLCYAVTDNRPDRVPVYKVMERGHVSMTQEEAADYLGHPVKMPPFRHRAYTSMKEDAEALAAALNLTVPDRAPDPRQLYFAEGGL
jgi:hypothetical protein